MPLTNGKSDKISEIAAVKGKIREILKQVNPEPQSKAPIIYHYSTSEGLYGILRADSSGTNCLIWASDMFCLNDASEMTYGMELAREVIGSHPHLSEYLEDVPKFAEGLRLTHSHVVCFSEEGDQLSQWRAYGSSGRGLSIGFDCAKLQEFGAKDYNFALFPLLYEQCRQRRILAEYLQRCEGFKTEIAIDPGKFWEECFYGLLHLLIQFKHPKFSEEKEWRLWMTGIPDENIKFRVMHSSIVPYTEVEVPKKLISSIQLGPAFNVEFGQQALRMFLRMHKLTAIVPHVSEIPLRNLFSG